MSRLHLLILWVLAIGAGIFYFKSKDVPESLTSKTKLEIGDPLISGNTVETIDGFSIKTGDDSVTVKKINGQWVVEELGNFPANLTQISRVFDALRKTKVAQGVVASPEYYDRFNLDPESEDTDKRPEVITLFKDGKENTIIQLGKNRESTGGRNRTAGRFVSLSNDDSGFYVVQESFSFLGADPDTWIEKILTPLEEGVIKMEVTAPNDPTFKPWTASRPTVQDDLLIEGLGEKEETKTNETATLKNAFSRAIFIEMINEEDFKKRADEKGTRQVTATDSGGSTFLITITPEKQEEPKEETPDAPIPGVNYLVTIDLVNGPTKPGPLAEDASVLEKATYQERITNLEELSQSVNRMVKTYKGRYFVVSKAAIGSLIKNRGEFIKAKKESVSVTTDPIAVPTPGSNPPSQGIPGTPPPPPGIARPKEPLKNTPKVEAVTPPIQIPPIPGHDPEQPKKPAEPSNPGEE